MKKLILIVFASSIIPAFGQNADKDSLMKEIKNYRISVGNIGKLSDEKLRFLMEKDTVVRVVYNNENSNDKIPAYFVNDFQLNYCSIKFIEPSSVESIVVNKDAFELNGRKYFGKIHIKLKDNVEFKPMSISDLKTKYLKLPELSSIFMIDSKVVYDNSNEVMINERSIYKIEVQLLDIPNENLKLNTINIITRTKDNIKKAEELRIKG